MQLTQAIYEISTLRISSKLSFCVFLVGCYLVHLKDMAKKNSFPVKVIEVIGSVSGLFVASYTGVLLSSTAVPV